MDVSEEQKQRSGLVKSDLIELFFIMGVIVLFSILPLFQVFLKINFIGIIFLVFLTVLFNAGANHLTKMIISQSNGYECNPIMRKTIEKKSSYFVWPVILITFLILVYLFFPLMIGNVVVMFTIVVAIDFIHDLRVKIYDKKVCNIHSHG